MRLSTRLTAILALLVALVLVAAACGDDDNTTTSASSGGGKTTTTKADKSGGDEAYIDIKGFSFTPPKSVKAGEKVEIRNMDSVTHTVTADDNSFDSGNVTGGGEGSITAPSKPGTYSFHCNIHASMKGQLVVT